MSRKPPRSAAIYARISSDPSALALGVTRQLEDCRALAADLGWVVAQEYVDNDLSAYSGKDRPAYRAMLTDIEAGRRDGVIAWHLDRLNRQPLRQEEFVQLCAERGVQIRTTQGSLDLDTGDGLLVARIVAAVAADESRAKSRRVRRKMQQVAEEGRPHGGAQRPFGFQDDKVTHRPAEAKVLRQLTARAIAGETLTSLCRWLDDHDVRTVSGKPWRTSTLSGVLTNPRLSGQRTWQGEVIGKAVWKPIITPEDTDRLRAILLDPARRTNRSARNYLLTGLLRCGVCGEKLMAHPRNEVRRYVCKTGVDFSGCGKIFVTAEPLERFIIGAVLVALDGPELARVLAGQAAGDERVGELSEHIAADEAQLVELAQHWADKLIDAAEWHAARKRIEARRDDARRQLSRLTRTTALDGWVGSGQRLRKEWDGLDLGQQRAIARAVIDHIVIQPGVPGFRGLDPNRVQVTWRA